MAKPKSYRRKKTDLKSKPIEMVVLFIHNVVLTSLNQIFCYFYQQPSPLAFLEYHSDLSTFSE